MNDNLTKRIFEMAAYFYGVDYHTIEIYAKQTNFDFGKLSLRDVYNENEKNLKIKTDLKLFERKYKIEKLIKKNENL